MKVPRKAKKLVVPRRRPADALPEKAWETGRTWLMQCVWCLYNAGNDYDRMLRDAAPEVRGQLHAIREHVFELIAAHDARAAELHPDYRPRWTIEQLRGASAANPRER